MSVAMWLLYIQDYFTIVQELLARETMHARTHADTHAGMHTRMSN